MDLLMSNSAHTALWSTLYSFDDAYQVCLICDVQITHIDHTHKSHTYHTNTITHTYKSHNSQKFIQITKFSHKSITQITQITLHAQSHISQYTITHITLHTHKNTQINLVMLNSLDHMMSRETLDYFQIWEKSHNWPMQTDWCPKSYLVPIVGTPHDERDHRIDRRWRHGIGWECLWDEKGEVQK